MDDCDRVDALIETAREDAEGKCRRALAPESHPDFDGAHCVEDDCGEPLPPARLAMGRIRCTECQARREAGR